MLHYYRTEIVIVRVLSFSLYVLFIRTKDSIEDDKQMVTLIALVNFYNIRNEPMLQNLTTFVLYKVKVICIFFSFTLSVLHPITNKEITNKFQECTHIIFTYTVVIMKKIFIGQKRTVNYQ
eukprot:TRINITY_DN6939_c0_g6_i1.p8 TRINITY_DN6939_c0_g6~~TRINITY_DN6939_c0_g6_i1.p8  ORF type:complete len:121 (+),score=1.05 TRINITY_DN6939_c0_g6_i1:968-1330(+)